MRLILYTTAILILSFAPSLQVHVGADFFLGFESGFVLKNSNSKSVSDYGCPEPHEKLQQFEQFVTTF